MANFLNLCPPAMLYMILSITVLVLLLLQNLTTPENAYCVGSVSCTTNYKFTAFLIKVIYTAFWTFILNCLCKSGYQTFSWLLVIIPFVLMFLLIAIIMLYGGINVTSFSEAEIMRSTAFL